MNRLPMAGTALMIGAAALSMTAPAFAASPTVPFYLAAPGSITCKQIDDARAQYAASSDLSVKTTDFVIVDQAIVGASAEIGSLDLGEIQAGRVAQHPDLWMHRTLDETMKMTRIIRDACAGHPAMTMRGVGVVFYYTSS
jgi:hypothetical protein